MMSKSDPEVEHRNSKVLNRKQIEKRLEGLHLDEYQRISISLKTQNTRLENQVRLLNLKVGELVQARKMQKSGSNPQVENEIAKYKKQLDLKYESMNHLKDQVRRESSTETAEERIRKLEIINQLRETQTQIKKLQDDLAKHKQATAQNDEELKDYLPTEAEDERLEFIRNENKQLRKKVKAATQVLNNQERDSKTAISRIYSLRSSEKKLADGSATIEMNGSDDYNIIALEQEIQHLKKKKQSAEKDLTTEKAIKEAKKSKLEKEIKGNLQIQKEIYNRRIKSYNQLNLYERRDAQLREIQLHESLLKNKEFQERAAQTQPVREKKEFRKEWIGKAEGLTFDDSDLVEDRQTATIKAVTIYKTPEQLSFVRFHYETKGKKKYESEPPFDKAILKKLESRRIESKSNASLGGIILSITSKRINRIELRWIDGDSSVMGWDTEGSTRFTLDITPEERPICLFGSVQQTGKGVYVLESLGCEIL